MSSKPLLSVVVLHYRNQALTKSCLNSVLKQDIKCSHEVVVLDNGSEENYPASYKYRRVLLSSNFGNIGGQNKAFEMALGEYVLFVSNDVLLHPYCINGMMEMIEDYPNFGQIMPLVHEGGRVNCGLKLHWPCYAKTLTSFKPMTPIVPSIIYLMRKEVWKKVGGFDETFISSHEDVDMGVRLYGMGYGCYVAHKGEAKHLGNQTLQHTFKDLKGTFHRARIMYINKHYQGLDRSLRLFAVKVINRGVQFLNSGKIFLRNRKGQSSS